LSRLLIIKWFDEYSKNMKPKERIYSLTIFFSIFSFSFFLGGCDYIYKYLDKEGAQEKELVGEVIPFEKNPTIEEIQVLLKIYGYNPGKIDGIFGLKTRNAIEKFQEDNGLKQTRYADNETWEKLSLFSANQLIVDNELNVKLVQKILKQEGYNPGKIDGKLGPRTKRAVVKFQKSNDLKGDGKVGYKTLTKMAGFIQ